MHTAQTIKVIQPKRLFVQPNIVYCRFIVVYCYSSLFLLLIIIIHCDFMFDDLSTDSGEMSKI